MANSKQDEYGQRTLLTLDGTTGTTANVLSDGGAIRTVGSEESYADIRYAYDSNNDVEYIGYHTDVNATTSGTGWLINKVTRTGGNITRSQLVRGGVWTNRESLF